MAVADGEVRRRAARPELEEAAVVRRIVEPEHRASPPGLCGGAEQCLGPDRVAGDDVVASVADELRETTSSAEEGPRCSHSHLAQLVYGGARLQELPFEAAVEAQREFGAHRGRGAGKAREGEQERLDAAEQVAGVDVQDAQGSQGSPRRRATSAASNPRSWKKRWPGRSAFQRALWRR